MMSFCRKSVHSFLGLNDLNCNNYYLSFENIKSSSSSPTSTSPCKHGLGLITDDMGEEACRSMPRVIESSVLKLLPPSPPSPPVKGGVFSVKKDPGGIGFIDEVGGGVDGLMSCTESLGFESSDERTVDDRIELGMRVESSAMATSTTSPSPSPPSLSSRAKWRKVGERRTREMKKFPPPLSWLNKNGQPSFFLRPVRKDGRLELTEVRIDRPEILHAYRKDGRLRLHLIRQEDDHFDHTYDNEFKEEEEQNYNQEIQQEEENDQDQEDEEEEEEEIEEKLMEEENQEGETIGEWKFPVTGEGFRRCNEPVVAHDCHHHHHHNMSHHHHNLHVWGQHYVTTR